MRESDDAVILIFFFLLGGATGTSGLDDEGETLGSTFGGFVLAITSGSWRGRQVGFSTNTLLSDNVFILGKCDVSLELGVDSESWELIDNVDRDSAFLLSWELAEPSYTPKIDKLYK